ncbi:uncharacterized protein si:dkeyp-69c1.9 isoform X6 [Channa argus]|uniref:uncharacterized protein si:dkeyp-69c1.9 isoform X6 n=1 Tax=Channa argus TaxID=215402 RepID=UPI00351FA8F7
MFIENANLQSPRRHHEVLLRSRAYRGELPTVAGFLLYPDTPSKMQTTAQEAFCLKPIPQNRGKGDEHLPSHSRTTLASTLHSGSSLAQSKERLSVVGPSEIQAVLVG